MPPDAKQMVYWKICASGKPVHAVPASNTGPAILLGPLQVARNFGASSFCLTSIAWFSA